MKKFTGLALVFALAVLISGGIVSSRNMKGFLFQTSTTMQSDADREVMTDGEKKRND